MKVLNIVRRLVTVAWSWVVYSSNDPQKLSLTLKGAIPFLLLFNFGDAVSLGGAVDELVHIIVLFGTWFTGALALYGALRKFYLTGVTLWSNWRQS